MGRGKRNSGSTPPAPAPFGMRSSEGAAAVQALLDRIYLGLEPDLDLDALKNELGEGLALIASLYPEANSAAVQNAVSERVLPWLAELGIGPSADGEL